MKPYVLHLHTLTEEAGSGLNTFYTMWYLRDRFPAGLAARPGGRLEERVREAGFDFFPVPSFAQPVAPREDLAAVFAVRELVRRVRPAVLHTHNSKAGFIGRLAARTLPRRERPAVVHTVHGFSFHDAEAPHRRALFRFLERIAFPWADAVIAISPALARWGASEGIGRASDYIVIPSGIEREHFRPLPPEAIARVRREVFGLPEGVLPIGLVAKLWEGKGHAVLLEAAARLSRRAGLPPFAVVFAGEGPLEAELRARAWALGIGPRVRFLGFRRDIERVTAALHIAVLPSRFEGMGRVVLEALACGVPVVASAVGGVVDVAHGGAILVRPGDAGALAGALGELLARPEAHAELAARARAAVGPDFDARTMAERIGEVYARVLDRRGAAVR